MIGLGLGLRILRADRRGLQTSLLTALGVAVATALSVLLLTLTPATGARAERSGWQQPTEGQGPVQVLRSDDIVGDDPLVRLDVALADGADRAGVPLAPGVPVVPGPGEVLLSPALADRAAALAPARLAQRFPGVVAGELDPAALQYPQQLVAVVGREPGFSSEATPAVGLVGDGEGFDILLAVLAGVGMVVLLVPCAVLVGSVARLTAARRERRLAALRLAGATPGQVVGVTVAETAVAAVGGTVLGLVAGLPLRFLAADVPWGGGTWLPSDLAPSVGTLLLVGLVVPTLVIAAATLALHRVLRSPVTAARAQRRRAPRLWRLLVPIAGAAAFVGALAVARSTGGIAIVLVALAGVALSISTVGPLLTWAVGGLFTTIWRRPATLLAGRRLRADPQAGYRAASGVVLAVFVATMALTVLPSSADQGGFYRPYSASTMYADLPYDGSVDPDTALAAVGAELDRLGLGVAPVPTGQLTVLDGAGVAHTAVVLSCTDARMSTRFAVGDCDGPPAVRVGPGTEFAGGSLRAVAYDGMTEREAPLGNGPVVVGPADGAPIDRAGTVLVDPALLPADFVEVTTIVVPAASTAESDVARTALVNAIPGAQVDSLTDDAAFERRVLGDLTRLTIIGLVVASVLAGLSAGVAAVGSVVDRRRTLAALLAAGTPVSTLVRASRAEAALPALLAAVAAGAAGFGVAAGLLGMLEIAVVTTPMLVAPVLLGTIVAVLASTVCGPALRRVTVT